MTSNAGHIIAKFKWETSFDKKDAAHELQQRLSSWSKYNMPAEINSVFDKICPPEQTWKIQTLAIDLGQIDYNNLEAELTIRLRNLLYETLQDQLIYTGRDAENFEIFNRSTTQLAIITSFLLHGVMPWNYKPTDGSINQVVAEQLLYNKTEIITAIKNLGVTHENARKRMAWQLNESNIVKIIEALEPSYNIQIVDFSKELTKIQAKESIVQTSADDFKRSVWLWILNYLLVERGTVFNRLAFIKSSIRQMAGHYNIGYLELFRMIESAVENAAKKVTIKASFLSLLQLLGKELRDSNNGSQPPARYTDHFQALEKHLHTPSAKSTVSGKAEFNDLVINLSKENPVKFNALVLQAAQGKNQWSALIKNLTDPGIAAIAASLNPVISTDVIAHIHFLDQLFGALKIEISRNALWQLGIKYIVKEKGAFSSAAFLAYIIAHMGNKGNHTYLQTLDKMVHVNIPPVLKTGSAPGIYTNIVSLYLSEITKDKNNFARIQLSALLTLLVKQLLSGTVNKIEFDRLLAIVVSNIRLQPKIALEILTVFKDKEGLRKLLPYLLQQETILPLVKHASNTAAFVILTIAQIIDRQRSANQALIPITKAELLYAGVYAVIFNPGIAQMALVELLFKQLAEHVYGSTPTSLGMLIQTILDDKQLNRLNITIAFKKKMLKAYPITGWDSVVTHAAHLAGLGIENRPVVASILTENFYDRTFLLARKNNNKTSYTLLNYFLPGLGTITSKLIQEQLNGLKLLFTQLPPNTFTTLTELYWICLLDYNGHNNNITRFKAAFETAVKFHFMEPGIKAPHLTKPITQDEEAIYTRFKNHFKNGAKLKGTTSADIHHLLKTIVESNLTILRNLLSDTAIANKVEKELTATYSFSAFSIFIAEHVNATIKEAILAMQLLDSIASQYVAPSTAKAITANFWVQIFQLIKTGRITETDLQKMVADTLHLFSKETPVDAENLRTILTAAHIRISPGLANILVGYLPALQLPEPAKSPNQKLLKAAETTLINHLAYALIVQQRVPAWYGVATKAQTQDLINELVIHYPVKLLKLFKQEILSNVQVAWLSEVINFKELTISIGALNRNQQALLAIIEKFQLSLGKFSVKGVTGKTLQLILFKKLIKAWTSDNWTALSTENILHELLWEVRLKYNVTSVTFLSELNEHKYLLPPALQAALKALALQQAPLAAQQAKAPLPKLPQMQKNSTLAHKTGISVPNAGIVLLNSYLPMFLERIGLVTDRQFTTVEAQLSAVHYLQYIATGLTHTEEALLPLNKVLCGIPLYQPVNIGITISDAHIAVTEGLINAMIKYWPAIGNCSIDGFRGNWLIREGVLTEYSDKWELVVEKRAYDLLMGRSPFSFSIIKYPWMDKPLHVTWPY